MALPAIPLLGLTKNNPVAAAQEMVDCCIPVMPNPIIGPRAEKCYSIDVAGEFLYWYWSIGGLDYMATGRGVPTATTQRVSVTSPGRAYFPDYKFEPGFRIGAAAHFGEDENPYDITAKYTYFHANPNGSFDGARDRRVSATAINWVDAANDGNVFVSTAGIDVSVYYNFLDVVTGYSFDIKPNLYVRPFAGLGGLYVHADLRVQYNYTAGVSTQQQIGIQRDHSSAWGIGPQVGFDSAWSMTKNLSIFGSAQFIVPVNVQNIAGNQTVERVGVETLNTMRIKADRVKVAFIEHFILGPRWDQWFCCERYHLGLQVAGEILFLSPDFIGFSSSTGNDSTFGAEIGGINISGSFEF